jgi:hypothetical protein
MIERNIVATVNLDCRLDLKTIALHARNAEYNPKVLDCSAAVASAAAVAAATTTKREKDLGLYEYNPSSVSLLLSCAFVNPRRRR